ncbi:MAG TPA: hypothetical protein VFK87_03625 [Steroidobacteraceae bacterium]|nr:hypothetical protein [Steroidobacteraceae bacterium]
MNLTTRGKWLTGCAAVVAAYVVFGPKDSDSVEPARTTSTSAHTHSAASGSPASPAAPVPLTRTLQQLAHRVVDGSGAGALFATHSWYVPPPAPPPPPPVDTAPVAPPKPVAPALPFTYMGSYAPKGAQPVFFLTRDDRVYDVHLGDTLDGTYSVDSFANGVLVFTYKPLNQPQQLIITGVAP